MTDLENRVDRLESLVEQQQETIKQQQDRIDTQAETIEELRSENESETTVSRRGAMKTAGLVGLLGAGTGAAAAGPTIGGPGNQVDTLYAQSLDGGLTGGTAVTDLVGDGLVVDSGSLGPALSSDLTLSSGEISLDVTPSDIGAASDAHDNGAHTQTYAVDGDSQPPETHGNGAHSATFVSSLSGGPGIAQSSLGDGDTISVDWSDADDLDGSGNVNSSISGGRYIQNNGGALDFVGQAIWGTETTSSSNSLDGDTEASVVVSGKGNTIEEPSWDVVPAVSVGILAGENNYASARFSGIVAGLSNEMKEPGDTAAGPARVGILAGTNNKIIAPSTDNAVIGGGHSNQIEGSTSSAIVAGGKASPEANSITNSDRAMLGAGGGAEEDGNDNSISSANDAFIGAGRGNSVTSNGGSIITSSSAIVAGTNNTATGRRAAVGAGNRNTVTGDDSSVLGGVGNTVSGAHAVVPGGEANEVRGDHALATGRNATVEADGAVALADATDEEFVTDTPGLHTQMETYTPEVNRVVSGAIDTDRVDPEEVLDGVTDVEVGATADGDGLCIDPAAFNDAFDLDGEELGTLDVEAALLGAVQALAAELDRLKQGSTEAAGDSR